MDKLPEKKPKKEYSTPKLTIYGTVTEVTKTIGLHGTPDGGTRFTSRTHV